LAAWERAAAVDRLCELNVIEQWPACARPAASRRLGPGQPLAVHGWIYAVTTACCVNLGLCVTGTKESAPSYRAAVAGTALRPPWATRRATMARSRVRAHLLLPPLTHARWSRPTNRRCPESESLCYVCPRPIARLAFRTAPGGSGCGSRTLACHGGSVAENCLESMLALAKLDHSYCRMRNWRILSPGNGVLSLAQRGE